MGHLHGHGHSHGHGGHPAKHSNQKDDLLRLVSYCSIVFVTSIIFIKLSGWYITNSLAMLGSLADSLLDICASIVNFIAIRYALQPPDKEHRFGHSKAEDLAVFTQSAFFGSSGLFLLYSGIIRLREPVPIEHNTTGIIVMAASIVITLILVIFQRYVIKKTGSNIVKADYLHYVVDLASNFAVIVSFIIARFYNIQIIDPILAILISLYLLHGSWQLLKMAFKNLMDHEFDEQERTKIKEIVRLHSEVKGLHQLRTRYAGTKPFIQFHLELEGSMTLHNAHRISDEIEESIIKEFPNAEVIIHQDPHRVKD